MMKRIAALALCLMLMIPAFAAAEAQEILTPMDEMFLRLKEALILLSLDETDQALELIKFVFDVESELTEESFRELAGTGLTLLDSGMVQTEVAVCWVDETGVYHFGIPLVEPIAPDVEAMVLCSRDLVNFSSYYPAVWGTLEEAAALHEEVYWNLEYQAGAPVLFADNE